MPLAFSVVKDLPLLSILPAWIIRPRTKLLHEDLLHFPCRIRPILRALRTLQILVQDHILLSVIGIKRKTSGSGNKSKLCNPWEASTQASVNG